MKKIIIAFLAYVCQKLLSVGGADRDYLELTGSVIGSGITGSIYQALSTLAIGLTVVYFMYELNSKWAFEGHDMNMKSLFAPFGKLIAAVVIIDQSEELWGTTFVSYYNGMITWADGLKAGALSPITITNDMLGEIIGVFGVLELLLIMIFCVLIMIVNWILKLLWNYKAVVFKFELLFRIGASPLAMADVYNGAHSNAWRWIKGFIGTTLYGCALILIPSIGAQIFGDFINNDIKNLNSIDMTKEKFDLLLSFLEYLFMLIVLPAAEIGCLGAVKQVLKEASS